MAQEMPIFTRTYDFLSWLLPVTIGHGDLPVARADEMIRYLPLLLPFD